MPFPIAVNILSDDDEDDVTSTQSKKELIFLDISSPSPILLKKKQKLNPFNPNTSTVFIIDDDPTPPPPPSRKSFSNISAGNGSITPLPSFVPETPFSGDNSGEKCYQRDYSNSPVPLIAQDTPISEVLKPKGLTAKTFVDYPGGLKPCSVPESPMSGLAKTEVPVVNRSEGNSPAPLISEDTPISDFLKPNVFNAKTFVDYPGVLKPCSVPETPLPELAKTEVPSGIGGLIYLESDNESEEEGIVTDNKEINDSLDANELERSSRLFGSDSSFGNYEVLQTMDESLISWSDKAGTSLSHSCLDSDSDTLPMGTGLSEETGEHKDDINDLRRKKKMSIEERDRLKEEKKKQKEQEKLQKAAEKAEAAEMKKLQKEKEKWEKGKLANKSIVAEIDRKVVEVGSVAGDLLKRFADKEVSYRITSNPIERSILWTMTIPEQLAQISEETEVRYIMLVYNAEEFCNLVLNGSLMNHVNQVQCRYPYHTICFLTNRLMSYINKREQQQYKNPKGISWTRPPVEEILTKLSTHFARVHTRQCIDEAELADHVVGLTLSLASCQFRKRLTRLSVNANGSNISKDCVDRNLIKKNTWLKALVAIPKVQPRFAIAIWKKYPTMKSLLSVYMDPSKTIHDKEMLLKDLITEGLLGDNRRVGEVCSKRVYRILMAECGNITTDDAEDGADLFNRQSS